MFLNPPACSNWHLLLIIRLCKSYSDSLALILASDSDLLKERCHCINSCGLNQIMINNSSPLLSFWDSSGCNCFHQAWPEKCLPPGPNMRRKWVEDGFQHPRWTLRVLVNGLWTHQFIVEVYASDTGVGAMLSQQEEKDNSIHPFAIFSCQLSAVEQNYNIRDRELLVAKLALEQWHNWLEGDDQPFLVLTDPKNLEYLRSAKRLNSCQVQWALFFNRFKFLPSYRPGLKKCKADALFHLFDLPKTSETV